MVPFLFFSSMDNNDLNPLERFIAKRERELEHKGWTALDWRSGGQGPDGKGHPLAL
jgi:hypothetical protein